MDDNGDDEGAAFFSQFDTDNDGSVSLSELKGGLEKKLSLKLTQRQARKVMELFDASGDGSLQQNEMVSFEDFHSRLQVLVEENKKRSLQSRKTRSILAGSRKSRRMSSNELSHLSLKDLEESEKTALKEDAKEQDQIIKRGAAIETKLESALGGEAEVTVEVWNPWPWTELFDKIADHYELDHVDQFVAVFATIDVDAGGTLDKDEIQDVLREAGVKISEEGVETLFNMIDEDGSGEIDQDEWREAVDFYLELKKEEKERANENQDNSDIQRSIRAAKLAQLGQSAKMLQEKKKKKLGILNVISKSTASLKRLGSKNEGDGDIVSPTPTESTRRRSSVRFAVEDVEATSLDKSNHSQEGLFF
jgi:Ca2+-binding EF-hand superfamily protein